MQSSELRLATSGQDGSRRLDQLRGLKTSVHRKLLQGGAQNARTIEIGTAHAAVIQLPVNVGVSGFFSHKIEQSDWRSASLVHLRGRESEGPRDRVLERAGLGHGSLRCGGRR
jgi:hypothetical protein